ncbi:antitoxin PaaA2 family protein [Sphingomonas sp. RS2018]
MAERDPDIRLGAYSERAEHFVASGNFDSIDDVVDAAFDALERQQASFNQTVRAKLAEALADPRPSIPIEEAFAQLDEMKARRRGA